MHLQHNRGGRARQAALACKRLLHLVQRAHQRPLRAHNSNNDAPSVGCVSVYTTSLQYR